MKLTKKFVAAIGLCALSACMLVTSTFAWFSMNETVTATGMKVMAKGDQIYLQIIEQSGTFEDGAKQIEAAATIYNGYSVGGEEKQIKLLPTSVRKNTGTLDVNALAAYDGTTIPGWVNAIGKDVNDGDADGDYTDVTSDANTNNGKYFLKNTFKIRLDPTAGATQAKAALKVSSVTMSASVASLEFTKSLRVLVVSTIGGTVKGDLWSNTTGTFEHDASKVLSADPFNITSAAAPAVVDIYVFFDGDDETCTLANLAKALEAIYTIDVNFTCAA